jgi:hypothetical protein
MANKAVTLICTAASKAAADALAATFPGGAGTFSVRLTTVQGGQTPTHYAGSGFVPEEMAEAFELSVDPMFKVFPLEGATFNQHLAECAPPLFRVVDVL